MTAAITVKLNDLISAFDWVSADRIGENGAYICRETGKVFWTSEMYDVVEKPPEDIDDATRYLAVPHKYDFDLGQNLVFRFVDEYLPEDYDKIAGFFRRKGAWRKFKDFLDRRDALDAWHRYEDEAVGAALREWSEDNGIELVDD